MHCNTSSTGIIHSTASGKAGGVLAKILGLPEAAWRWGRLSGLSELSGLLTGGKGGRKNC